MTDSDGVVVRQVKGAEASTDGHGTFKIKLMAGKRRALRMKVDLTTADMQVLDSEICRSIANNCELTFSQERFPAGRHILVLHRYYYEFEEGRWYPAGRKQMRINVVPGYIAHVTVDWDVIATNPF